MMFPCPDEILTLESIYCVDRSGTIRDVGKLAMSCEHPGQDEAWLGFHGAGDHWDWWGDRDRVEKELLIAVVEAEVRFAALAARIIMAIYDESEPAPVCAITLHLRISPHGPETGLCLAGSWIAVGYAQETSVYARSVRVNLALNRSVSWTEDKPDPGLAALVLPFLEPLAGLLRQLPPADGLPSALPGLSI